MQKMPGKQMSIACIVAGSIVAFLAINIIHFRYFAVRVLLFDALLDALLAVALVAGILTGIRHRLAITREETGLSLLVGLLLAILYALSVPTIIDRSLSIYLLEKLEQRGGSIRRDAFEDIVKQEFFPEHRLIDIRLTEQLNSGTIAIEGGCVRLTAKGKAIAQATRTYRGNLLPRKRQIADGYSDDLTDPFRKTFAVVPFKCD